MGGSILSPMWYLIGVTQCSLQHEIPVALLFIRKSDEQELMDGKLGGLGSIAKGACQKQESNTSALP